MFKIKNNYAYGFLILALLAGCTTQTPNPQATSEKVTSQDRSPSAVSTDESHRQVAAQKGNLLNYQNVIDINDSKGKSFLWMMQKKVKPALDKVAKNGFRVVDGSAIPEALANVHSKVSQKATRSGGSEENLAAIADKIFASKKKSTVYNLPEQIKTTKLADDAYGTSTFLALASGGGVAVKIDDYNYTYHVNYGTGEQSGDEKSGRSFGESHSRKANDASDAAYLEDLQNYAVSSGENLEDFYRALLQILLNSDASQFRKISREGQAVATDFIAVYIAEQDRHLMANLKSHPWDDALLQVTLLAAFHAGQEEVKVMYSPFGGNPRKPEFELTKTTFKQTSCKKPDQKQKASMVDYWQFTSNPDPKNCKRSGINITRQAFEKLGQLISDYQYKNNREIFNKVARHFKGFTKSGNLFADFSSYIIRKDAPDEFADSDQLIEDFVKFLMQVREDADKTTGYVIQSLNPDR